MRACGGAVALLVGTLVLAAAAGGQEEGQAEEAARAVVWAVGDGADGSARAKRLARLIAGERPDRFLYLGDVYETGTAEEFERNFARCVRRRWPRSPQPTPGNHEWGTAARGLLPVLEVRHGPPPATLVPLQPRAAGRSSA